MGFAKNFFLKFYKTKYSIFRQKNKKNSIYTINMFSWNVCNIKFTKSNGMFPIPKEHVDETGLTKI